MVDDISRLMYTYRRIDDSSRHARPPTVRTDYLPLNKTRYKFKIHVNITQHYCPVLARLVSSLCFILCPKAEQNHEYLPFLLLLGLAYLTRSVPPLP